MLSKWKLSVLAVCGVFCSVSGFPAFADTEAATEAPEEIRSGEYTYYINEEYGGAVISAYEPDEAEITLPEEIDGNTVVGLENFLFNNQNGIEKVHIPETLRHIGASAFFGTNITEFTVDENNPAYKVEDGVLFSKDGIALVAYPPSKQDASYTVPDGVEELYHGCFASCDYLYELNLPDSIIYVDTWTFAYTPLKELTIPDNVTQISSYACAFMKQLEEVTLSQNLLSIDSAAFAGCNQLMNIEFPQTLVGIGQGAFAGAGMKSVVIPASVEEIGYCAFGYSSDLETSYSTFTLYGLSGSAAETYATDTDEEYGYENNFNFIAKSESQLAEMKLDADGNEIRDEAAAEVIVKTEQDNESSTGDIMKIVLLGLGGIVLCGGIGAVAISSSKNKKKKDN